MRVDTVPYTNTQLVNHLNNNLNGSESIIYYIHDETSSGTNVGYGSGNAVNHFLEEEHFIEHTFNSIDSVIDLDFTRSYSYSGSDIDIYALTDHGDWGDSIAGSC